jgi:hypothetical protein
VLVGDALLADGALVKDDAGRGGGGRRVIADDFDGKEELVAPAGDGGDEVIFAGAFFEGSAEGGDALGEAVEFDVGVGPDVLQEFFAGDDLAGALGEVAEDVEGAAGKGEALAVAGEASSYRVQTELTELQCLT